MLNLSQENKSDFGEGKTGRRKRNRKSPWQKKPPRSPTALPLHGSERSIPAGRGGVCLPRGPFCCPRHSQGGWKGQASWKLLPPSSWAQGRGGKRRAKSPRAAGASVRTKPVAASGRRRGQGGQLGDIQNKATAPMKWMTVATVSFRSATIRVSPKPYSTQRVRKRVQEQRCGFGVGDVYKEGWGEGGSGGEEGNKIQKITEAKALQTI